MKRLISFFLVFNILTLFVYGESYVINHQGREITLYIPDSYEELRESYIEVAKLYIGERVDLEESLELNQELIDDLQIIKENLKEIEEEFLGYREIMEEALKPKLFSNIITIGTTFDIINGSPSIKMGYGIEIREKYIIGFKAYFPLSVGVAMGVKF